MTTGDGYWDYRTYPYVLRDDQRGPDHDHATETLEIFVDPWTFTATLAWEREVSADEWEVVARMRITPLHMAQLQMALHDVYGDALCPTCRRPKYIEEGGEQ